MPAASGPLLRISVSWIRLTQRPAPGDGSSLPASSVIGDQPQRRLRRCRFAGALAGEAVEEGAARFAAAGDIDRLGERDPPAGMAATFRIDLDQPEQEIEGALPLLPVQGGKQAVGAAAEDAG